MSSVPPGSRRSSHRRRRSFSLREFLGPRDGTEVAAWAGILIFVLVFVVAGILIVFGGTGSNGPGTPKASASPGGETESSSSGPLDNHGVWDPYVVTSAGGAAGTAANQALWTPVVQQFVTDFLDASHDPHWLAKVQPLVSPQLLARLRRVDRSEIPKGTLSTIDLVESGDNAADVTAAYTANDTQLKLKLGVVDLPGDRRSWMVFSYADAS
jgi:hypothetical protein